LIWFGYSGRSPLACAGRGGPNAAMLQLARRPAITGFGFCTARAAESGSRKTTCGEESTRNRSETKHLRMQSARGGGRSVGARRAYQAGWTEWGEKLRGGGSSTYEAVALGPAGLAIGDDDGLEYLAVCLEVLAQPLGRRLPRQAPHEHLGQRRVAEPRPVVVVRGPGPPASSAAAAVAPGRVARGSAAAGGRRRSRHLMLTMHARSLARTVRICPPLDYY